MSARPTGFMPQPNFYISQENYERLIGSGFWRVNDLRPDQWGSLKEHFGGTNTLAVLASGRAPIPTQPPSGNIPVAGIDWVKIETKLKPQESSLNVYHYAVGHPDQRGYPVYGPFKSGAMVEHWSNLDDLGVYFAPGQE